jgi:hypothetical protein
MKERDFAPCNFKYLRSVLNAYNSLRKDALLGILLRVLFVALFLE